MKNIRVLFSLLVLLMAFNLACTKKVPHSGKTPEEVVQMFVTLSTQVKNQSDKNALAALCSDEMKKAFEDMNEEAFELSYISNPLELKEFTIMENNTLNEIATIRYKVTVSNQGGTDPTTETTERRVALKKDKDAWYLTSITPVGTDTVHFTRGMIF